MRVQSSNEKINDIDSGLKKIIDDIEKELGINLMFSSIKRSEEKNKSIGGWKLSQHVDWDEDGDSQAVDALRSSFKGSPELLAKTAYKYGATGVGIYNGHVHIDNNPDRVDNPFFKDWRTNYTKYDESKGKITFSNFSKFYNKELAEKRKGKNDLLSKINASSIDNEVLVKIGIATIAVLITYGILSDD